MSDIQVDVYTEDRIDPEEAVLLDPSSLDPNYYYRWVQVRPQSIARKKAAGFSLVSRKTSGVKPVVELERTADDTIRFADMVLMSCPKDRYLARRAAKSSIVRDRLEATSQRFKEKVEVASRSGLDVKITEKFQDKGETEDDE